MPAVKERKGLLWDWVKQTERMEIGWLLVSEKLSSWVIGKCHWEAEERNEALVDEEQGRVAKEAGPEDSL